MKKLIIGLILGLVVVGVLVGASMTRDSNDAYDVELQLYEGWNIIAGTIPEDGIASDSEIQASDIKVMWYYSPIQKKYLQVYPNTDWYNLQKDNDDFVLANAMWVYSEKSGTIKYSTLGDYLHFVNEVEYNSDKRKLYAGWNFVPITLGMTGKNLGEIKGSCNLETIVVWDNRGQVGGGDWDSGSENTLLSEDVIGLGIVIKVSSDCDFGSSSSSGGTSPPGLPVVGDVGCTDTDGGVNYDEKGETCNEVDCIVDVCTSMELRDDVVAEYYCDNNQRKSEVRSCDYKCEGGACITKPEQKCTDSDGGTDYNIKGKVITENIPGIEDYNEIEDRCFDSEKIMENYCGPGEGIYEGLEVAKVDIYECPNGCSDGACL
tara:strand:- start:6151 stop:7275 length:1125 start_codon:yes stop_codon:yes gene_type:complete